MLKALLLLSFAYLTVGQQDYTTPVPILKQINRQNEDGSYSYGYEGADGSFKIETKYANGEVYGKYGYVDDAGKVREVEYGATKRGFEPQGNDINVPPPTVNNDNANLGPLGPNEQDDGQYREDPSIYYKDSKYNSKSVTSNLTPSRFSFNQKPQTQPQPQPQYREQQLQHQPQYRQQQPQYQQQSQLQYQPQYQSQNQQYEEEYQPEPQPRYTQTQHNNIPTNEYRSYNNQPYHQQPQQPAYNYQQQQSLFNGHPATDFDINTGSYSLTYTG